MKTWELLSSLRACTNSKLLNQGKLLHQKILSFGLQHNISVINSLINLYISCHSYNSALVLFYTIKSRFHISSWNRLFASCTRNFLFSETIDLFIKFLDFPILKPNASTYPTLLKACGVLRRIKFGKSLHASVTKTGLVSDVFVASSLVGFYSKCRLFDHAVKVFDEMPERDVPSWNSIISCYFQAGRWKKALEMFDKMNEFGFEPSLVTLTTAISSCGKIFDLERGREIHWVLMRNRIPLDAYISSALVDMYGKCGCLEMARLVFEQIPKKNESAWNSLIAGYALKGDIKSCIKVFKAMNMGASYFIPTLITLTSLVMACSRSGELRIGKSIHAFVIRSNSNVDIYMENSLIDLYMKCASVRSAGFIFQRLAETDTASWNIMISGYTVLGHYFEALRMFRDMKDAGLKPDTTTFASVLPACSQLGMLEQGKEIHNSIIESEMESNEVIMGAVLDMYAKCGSIEDALIVFYQLPVKDLVSWTSMISAFGSHGLAFEALKFFHYMLRSRTIPDGVVFLAVMYACSHAGLVNQGCYLFNLMITGYGLKPTIEIYSCLIDLLGRAGRLKEAYGIIHNTRDIRNDRVLLSTLFNACHLCGEFELGKKISKLLIDMNPHDLSTYIILSNMYASAKKWDDVRKVRVKMKELGLKLKPGCSWIEVDKRIQLFVVEKIPPNLFKMLYECLEILSNHMEKDDIISC